VPPYLADAARSLGLDLDATALDRLVRYRDLIAQAAREFNLTAVRDPAAIERRHLGESLAFGAVLAQRGLLPAGARVIDIGSGAGLPGIPLKIAWPSIRLSLLEAAAKKCRFLERAARELALDGVDVLQGRAEDFAHHTAQRAAYDLAIGRAVAPLPVLLEYALPFLRLGGCLAAMKGSRAQREIAASGAALEALGGRLDAALDLYPPDGLRQTIVLISKPAPTPERYPRRAGVPAKRPLG
jgi:16S rRNA (guanine527-N7)-methyltransferase